jgi:hypothetical protein
MPLYRAYFFRDGEVLPEPLCLEAGSDAEALAVARVMLDTHPSARSLVVLEGVRPVDHVGLPAFAFGTEGRAIADSRRQIDASRELLRKTEGAVFRARRALWTVPANDDAPRV